MPDFIYEALAKPNSRTKGTLTAESEHKAAQLLMEAGLHPIGIRRQESFRGKLRNLSLRSHLGNRERGLLARQLADLIASGMPVHEALQVVEDQTEYFSLRKVIPFMQRGIREGGSLADAMEALPRDFKKIHVSLVRAGERGGLLTTVLENIAELEERELELRSKIRAALTYPAITAMVGFLTVLVILNFVIPRLSEIFLEIGDSLPRITKVLLFLSGVGQWMWGYSLLFLVAILVGARLLQRSERWLFFKDALLLRVPRLGRLLVTMEVARFTGVLGSLQQNGVSLVPALEVTGETLQNRKLREGVTRAIARVNQGVYLGRALEETHVFPRVVTGMISVGEETGNMEVTLKRISEGSFREGERKLQLTVSLIEPSLIIVMGLLVAFLVAAVLLPIFQVNLAL